MERSRLQRIERYILSLFADRGTGKLLAKDIFASTSEFANADLVRAFEDLEKKWRFLIRYTSEGNDWVSLTQSGSDYLGIDRVIEEDRRGALLHPPRSVP